MAPGLTRLEIQKGFAAGDQISIGTETRSKADETSYTDTVASDFRLTVRPSRNQSAIGPNSGRDS